MLTADQRRVVDAVRAAPSGVAVRDVRDDVEALRRHLRQVGGPALIEDDEASWARVRRFLLDRGEV